MAEVTVNAPLGLGAGEDVKPTILRPEEPNRKEGWDERRRQLKAAMVARDSGDIEPLKVAIEAAEEVGLEEKEINPAMNILRRLEEQEQPLTFTDIPRTEMEELQAAKTYDAAVAVLSKCLRLSPVQGFQSDILVEFHYHNFAFCQRSGFCAEKTSTLISIFKVVHTKAVVEEKLPEQDARFLFDELVDRHSQQLPPYRVGVFSREEAAAIKAFAARTFFRHYKMYAFAYVKCQELSVRASYERIVPVVPVAVQFRSSHEVNPREVPELQDLFLDPEGMAAAEIMDPGALGAKTTGAQMRRFSSKLRAVDPVADTGEAEVASAIDEVMKGHHGALEAKLKLPFK
mmetsp:Transcript_58093/g.101691  ORF Transcript_58093/g.101691 Transcript_58093/m.101691 type:complete len:344 (+) Transcript_58093:49-1080(+)